MPEAMGSTVSQIERMETVRRKERTARAARPDASKFLHEPRLKVPSPAPKSGRQGSMELDADSRALLRAYEMQRPIPPQPAPQSPAATSTPQENSAPTPPRQQHITTSQPHHSLLDPPTLKRINHFARRHEFFMEQSLHKYTTSQRRLFERAVYDYARSISLSKAQAKASIVHARSMCGEGNYDSDDTRLDDDEVDDSVAVRIGLVTRDSTSSATQTLPPTIVQTQPQANVAKNDNARKRRSDVSDNGSGKGRRAKRVKVNKDTKNGPQAKTQGARVIVTWMETKRKLLTAFENAALLFHDWPTIDNMEETILESIRYAAKRMTFEIMDDRPVLLDRFSEAFRSGALAFFNKRPKSKGESLRHGRSLRSTLNSHVDAAMVRRIEEKEQHGQASDQFNEDSGYQSVNSREDSSESRPNSPESSRDSPTQSDASIDYGYDEKPTTSKTDGPNFAQYSSSETTEATFSPVIGTIVLQKGIEQKVVELVQDISEKYDHDQLAPETKAMLKTAFQAHQKHYAGEDETEDSRLLRQKWLDLIRNDQMNGSEIPSGSQEVILPDGKDSGAPFARFGDIRNAWEPWTRGEPTDTAGDLDVSLSALDEALNGIVDTTPDRVEDKAGPDGIQLSESEQPTEVPEEGNIEDAGTNERLHADLDITSVKQERQHTRVKKEEPEMAPNLEIIPTGIRSAKDQHDVAEQTTPHMGTPPIPSKCVTCKRVFPSGNAFKRHLIFYHGAPLGGLWPDAAERDRKYRLYLQEDMQHEGAFQPLVEDAASVQAQPSEVDELPAQSSQPAGGRVMETIPQPNQLQCRQCNDFFGSKNELYEHLELIHKVRRRTRGIPREPIPMISALELANEIPEKCAEIVERPTHVVNGFSKPDDPTRMTAAGEEVLGHQAVFGGLRLRGGGATDVNAAASANSDASLSETDESSSHGNSSFGESDVELKSPELLTSKIWALVDIVKRIERAFTGDPYVPCHRGPTMEPVCRSIVLRVSSASSSPLSSAPSSPIWPTPSGIIEARNGKGKEELEEEKAVQLTPLKLRKSWSKTSPYFLPSPKVPKETISCIPFPPLSSISFGLVQESLASEPFHLLIAVIFLNKTRGAVAMPVFYNFITRFANPSSLAAANIDEVVSFFQNLGLQNQRAKKCIALAKAWLEHPPARGKRWRRLNYPNPGDGKGIKGDDEPVADETEDARIAWEIGHLPGIGAYGIDSWRIFCRDQLRGLGTAALPDLPAEGDEVSRKKTEEEELRKEWARVLPLDKELRAYLRWRWMRLGWEWDPKTGERTRADARVINEAAAGGVICEGEQGWSMNGEGGHDEIRKMGSLY